MNAENIMKVFSDTAYIRVGGRPEEKKAAEYLAGEENNNTPCTPGGCYDRLRSCGGKILLVGVGHERNTFIHSVEEVLNVPHRLSDKPMKLQIVMPDGSIKDSYMRKHYNADQPHISEDFVRIHI